MPAENNGGKTSYYDLPRPSKEELISYLGAVLPECTDLSLSIVAEAILDMFPSTLNDLIEHRNMKPWQHEVFKACYALDARAQKNGGSEEREINKIIYYAQRGLNFVRNKK